MSDLSTTNPVSWDDLLDAAKKLTAQRQYQCTRWAWSGRGACIAPLATMILQQGEDFYNGDLTRPTSPRGRPPGVPVVRRLRPGGRRPDLATTRCLTVPTCPRSWPARWPSRQDGYWFGGNLPRRRRRAGRSAMAPGSARWASTRLSPDLRRRRGRGSRPRRSTRTPPGSSWSTSWRGQPAEDRAKRGWGLPVLKSLLAKLPADLPYQKQAYQTAQDELPYAASDCRTLRTSTRRRDRTSGQARAGQAIDGQIDRRRGGQGDHRRGQQAAQAGQGPDRMTTAGCGAGLGRGRLHQPAAAAGSGTAPPTFYLFVSPWVLGFLLLTPAPLGVRVRR